MKKDKDFMAFPLPMKTNPLIIRKSVISCIIPDQNNQLQARIYIGEKDEEYFIVDEPTSSIEGRLC